MAFRMVAQLDGDMTAILLGQWNDMSQALAAMVGEEGKALQTVYRNLVIAAGLGQGLAKAWQILPPGGKFKFLALVFSKAVRLHWVFSQSITITVANAKWLVIPLPPAIKAGWAVRRQTRGGRGSGSIPAKWSDVAAAIEALDLRFVLIGNNKALLLKPRKNKKAKASSSDAYFLLVKQVKLTQRYDLDGPAQAALSRIRSRAANILGGSSGQ